MGKKGNMEKEEVTVIKAQSNVMVKGHSNLLRKG